VLGDQTTVDWRSHAACRGMPSEMFVSPDKDVSSREVDAAKEVCSRCLVIDDCLTFAITNSVTVGVWGGLSAAELAPLRSTWRAQRATVA
jgi:WhiB family redox-sensing transcriptional regulator